MTWQINETVVSGNSTARVKNYYTETGLLVLYDIKGTFTAGMTVTGQTSGTTKTLSNFVISDAYDLGFEPGYNPVATYGAGWFTYFNSSATNEYLYGVTISRNKNILVCGYYGSSAYIVKYDSSGNVVWQKTITGSEINSYNSIAVDTNENVYAAADLVNPDFTYRTIISKFDSTGTLLWSKKLTTSDNTTDAKVAVDGNDNSVYLSSNYRTGSIYRTQITKLDSSGNVIWQKKLGDNVYTVYVNDLKVDLNGTIHVSGYSEPGTSAYSVAYVARISSSGSMIWQKLFLSGTNYLDSSSVAYDSSGNTYSFIMNSELSPSYLNLVKIDSSGNLVWQRAFPFTSGTNQMPNAYTYYVDVDRYNNIIVSGVIQTSSGYVYLMAAKYNTSGVLQWVRYFGYNSYFENRGVTVDNTGNFILIGYGDYYTTPYTQDMYIVKLPADGSRTGNYVSTYGTFTYASASYTDAAGTLTVQTATQPISNDTFTLTNYTSLTVATATLSQVKTAM